jgi:uracil-DNA glycosylase family 4
MSDSPRDDLTELTRALIAHVAWQRDLGAVELLREGSLPAARAAAPEAPVEAPPLEGARGEAPPLEGSPVAAPPSAPSQPPPAPVVAPGYAAAPSAPPPPVARPPASPAAVRPLFVEAAAQGAARARGPALEGPARVAALQVIHDEVKGCTACRLVQKRTHTVFSRGNPFARLCFIGEGPGEQEDRTGSPFVGPAGQLLDRIIGSMGLDRDEVYVCNVVKCRPPYNRTPEADEMHACSPFLVRQLDLVRPEVIVALGRTAVGFLLDTKDSMTRLRGRWHSYEGIPVLPTWHPSYILRQPPETVKATKAETWADMKLVMARLGLQPPTRP